MNTYEKIEKPAGVLICTASGLPYPLRIAAGATQLDKVKIVPINYRISVRKTVFVLKHGNWQDRLVNKAVDVLNEDIRVMLIGHKNLEFHVWKIADVKENPIFVTLNMCYKFR